MRRVVLAAECGLLAAALVTTAAAAELVRLRPVARGGRVLVSFELTGGFTDSVEQAVASGLAVTFLYDVALRQARPWWWDRTIAQATVTASVRYDTLRREYRLSRLVDGRVEETRVVTDRATVGRFATVFERLPLFSTAALEPNGEYYIRVRAETRPRDGWFRWPWERALASASVQFTFLP
jgi:hypothetical protein